MYMYMCCCCHVVVVVRICRVCTSDSHLALSWDPVRYPVEFATPAPGARGARPRGGRTRRPRAPPARAVLNKNIYNCARVLRWVLRAVMR